MEVITKNIIFKAKFPFTVEEIENEIKKNGINPLRWAIVNANGDKLTISVSGETLC
jgi:hypothetical protein